MANTSTRSTQTWEIRQRDLWASSERLEDYRRRLSHGRDAWVDGYLRMFQVRTARCISHLVGLREINHDMCDCSTQRTLYPSNIFEAHQQSIFYFLPMRSMCCCVCNVYYSRIRAMATTPTRTLRGLSQLVLNTCTCTGRNTRCESTVWKLWSRSFMKPGKPSPYCIHVYNET